MINFIKIMKEYIEEIKNNIKNGKGIFYYYKNDKYERKSMMEIGKMIIEKEKI